MRPHKNFLDLVMPDYEMGQVEAGVQYDRGNTTQKRATCRRTIFEYKA
jgi:hypothetical protein